MKLTILFILLFAMQLPATIKLHGQVSMDIHDKELRDVFKVIEGQSTYRFFYNESFSDLNKKVNARIDNMSISETLDVLLTMSDMTYKVLDNNLIVIVPKTEQQQQNQITGRVTDAVSGQTLPGVTVSVKGTTIGTSTDINGVYSLNVPTDAETLVFSFIGMSNVEVEIGDRRIIDVVLQQDIMRLDEVVVVGYGTQRRSDFTGAIYAVSSDKIQDMPNTNIFESLQGLVPGMVVTNSQSVPGSNPQIRIRGENSLSASNNPLVILDGMPYEGDINMISTNDIESVNVLKDASAAAIYGARAANGVIIITTKRGRTGKAQINYSGYFGVQTAEKMLDLMDGPTYFQFKVDAARNQGNVTDFSPESILNSAELPQYYAGTETDWQDMILRTGPQQEHNISVSGGTDNTKYYTSLNYLDQKGIIEFSGMKRFTLRANIDHDINNWLKTGANIQLTNRDLSGFRWSTVEEFGGKFPAFQDAVRLSPYGAVRDETGRYTHFPEFPNTFYHFTNPFGNYGSTFDNVSKRGIVHLFGQVDFPFLEGLSYRLNYGIDYDNREIGSYWPTYTFYGAPDNGIAETNSYTEERWTWENMVTYTKEIDLHKFDFTGLYSRESFAGKRFRQDARGFVNDDNLYFYNESAETKTAFSSLTDNDLVSYMGRINYNYDNRYYITTTVRRDGYSGFGANEKYGVFPSVALSWTPSQESFMQNAESLDFIDFLKVRASIGENGNMGISPYQTLDALRTANYIWGGNTANGLQLQTVGNPFLKWESTVTFNVGLDYAIFNNRIYGNFDYYQSHSQDLIMSRQLPVMNGYTSILFNVGETENKGFELNLNTVNVRRNKLEWTTSLNFSLNRDKILELRGDGKDDLANNWFIGEPLRVYYDYEREGIWQTGDDIANSHMPTAKPGTVKLVDKNDDGIIDASDRIILGSRLPSWVAGLTNTVSYGNWNFSVYINTVQGILKQNNVFGTVGSTYLDIPYWREDRPSNEYAAPGLINPVASGVYKDASYVRIKDASVSYTFPSATMERFGLGNMRLFISGKNLYTFTDWMGYDPEASHTLAPYPNSRIVIMGVNLGF